MFYFLHPPQPPTLIPYPTLKQCLIAIFIGLLVGFQRERSSDKISGIRTFPLLSLLGFLSALLCKYLKSPWLLVAAFLGVVALLVIGNILKLRQDEVDVGMTTEASMLTVFLCGAFTVYGPLSLLFVCVGLVLLLLESKPWLHKFVKQVGENDIQAVLLFILLSFIILPILPNKTFGPYKVLNPYEIWLMVVLVVGISLSGYILYKVFGQKKGSLWGGLLGGLISSTATATSYARQSKSSEAVVQTGLIVILLSSTVAQVRVLLEVLVVAPSFLQTVLLPLGVLIAVSILLVLGTFWITRNEHPEMPEQKNPTELKTALIFGFLYGLVLFLTAVVKQHFQNKGLYAVALISGLTDMDAITLSSARLVKAGKLQPTIAMRMILLATMANLAFKAGIVISLGHKKLGKYIVSAFGLIILSGLFVLWFF